MGCNPAMMVDPLGLRSAVFDNGSRPFHTADVPIPMWPVNTNARFALLDQMMYADQDAFHEWVKNQLIAEAAGEEAFAVLNALDYGLSLLGFESKSISAALGRSTTVAGVVQGNDVVEYEGAIIDHSTLGTNRQSYQFGYLKVSFSTRGGGLGAEYLEDETDRRGIWIFAVYKGDLSAYEKTDWIQSVYSTIGINGNPSYEWFNDFSRDNDNKGKYINRPFYYNRSPADRAWRRDMDKEFGGRIFHDGPNRKGYASSNFTWSAQLSLVGLRNGKWETIQTIRYGFTVKGSTVTYNSMLLNNFANAMPNYFHQNLINQLNSYRK